MYHWDFGAIWVYHKLLLSGLAYTVVYTIIVVAAGLAVGLVVGIGRVRAPAFIVTRLRIRQPGAADVGSPPRVVNPVAPY